MNILEAKKFLTQECLDRWNHLRFRAGLDPLTAEQAIKVWTKMSYGEREMASDRIN